MYLVGGIQENNFKQLSAVFQEAMKNVGAYVVPVLAAEDETAIIGQISNNEVMDELQGFCGVSGDR